VNIYSHLFGAVLFASLPFYIYSRVYPRYVSAQLGDIIVFSTFFFGVAICFLLSASYGLFPLGVPPSELIADVAQLPYYREPQ
jgi:adiponectin receptor